MVSSGDGDSVECGGWISVYAAKGVRWVSVFFL